MSKLRAKSFTFLFVVALANLVASEPLQGSDNICNITVPVTKDIIVVKPIKYEIPYQGWCNFLPCTKTRIETRYDQTTKSLIQYEERRTFCPGYTETEGNCVPICLKSCNNGGKCVGPNVCKCSPPPMEWTPGFDGPTCARFTCLGENRWGSKCDKECNCPLNAYCSANTGKCLCYPGYRGANCTIECSRDSNDPECEEINELPIISEPDVNLLSDSAMLLRQRSEALVLERTPDETLQQDNQSSFGANYLVGVMVCLLLVTSVGLYILKHRYDRLKTEIIYASGSSGASSTGDNRGSPSEYSSTTYYASPASTNTQSKGSEFFSSNLSFKAATRLLLHGSLDNKAQNQDTHHQQHPDNTNHRKLIVNPLVESHLINSHKSSEQNLYSDINKTAVVDFSARPLPNPEASIKVQEASSISDNSQYHIYQVPKTHNSTGGLETTSPAPEQNSSLLNQSSDENTSAAESQLYRSFNQDLNDCRDPTIYEEIKHSNSSDKH